MTVSNPTTAKRQPLQPCITLSTGRTVRHRYAKNGSQETYFSDGGVFKTEAEYSDYLAKIKHWHDVKNYVLGHA